MLRYFIQKHNATSIPLPTVSATVLELIIKYLRHYIHVDPVEILVPITSEYLGDCGALEWDIQFVHMGWTLLFDVLLAANFMGIVPLVDLICAKICIALKYPQTEDTYPYSHQLADSWPEVVQNLTQVYEACARQERTQTTVPREPQKGDLVRIQHLSGKQATNLNGLLAEVLDPIPCSTRVGVSVLPHFNDRGGKQVSIKPCNLVVLPLTPKYLINRATSWYLGWLVEVSYYT